MIRIFSLLGYLLLVYSCNDASKAQNSTNETKTDIDNVKTSLSKWDEIPSDSIHVVKLKESGLYITQGFGRVDNMIRLVKINPNRFVVLDSIRTFRQIDIFKQPMIHYNYQSDWFIYSDISSGTGDLSKTVSLVRVKDKRFSILFTYSKSSSFIDVEVIPSTVENVEVRELKMNKKQIVLISTYHKEYEHSSNFDPVFTDTITFDFSPGENRFIWKKSTNPAMKDKWWPDKGEYLFRI